MKKKVQRTIGLTMFILAVSFLMIALNNPQLSFSIDGQVLYAFYLIYLLIMVILIVAPFGNSQKKTTKDKKIERKTKNAK